MATARTKVGIVGGLVAAATLGGALFLTSSNEINVPVGSNLQAAINDAGCGTTLVLEANQSYAANVTLPKKDCGDQWITIQSSRAAELPEGARVGPAQAQLFARLQSTVNAGQVINTAPGAHHYRFIGIQFETRDEGVFVYDLVRLGASRGYPDAPEQTTLESVPHNIVIDRSWVAGRPNQQTQRGVSLNCRDCGITNSHIDNIIASGMDTQAVCAWNTPGPVHIINNYLSATGEIVMLGGSDPANEAMVPSNVEIRRNHLHRPMAWKGKGYTIKNGLEIKNGKNVTIDGNLIENNWCCEGQSGPTIVFTVRNQEGSAPYSIITNVSFTNNIVRNSDGAINLLGKDNIQTSQQASALLIRNNVFDQINGHFLTMNGYHDVTIEQNTHLQTSNTMTLSYNPSLRFVYRNNVTLEKAYGIIGDFGLIGTSGLEKWTPGYVFAGNVIAHPSLPSSENWYAPMPPGNEYPEALVITTDYRTPYAGKGADIDALLAAQAGANQPLPLPSPTATATPAISPIPIAVSPDNSRVPPLGQLVVADPAVWVLSGNLMLRNGSDSGGRGSQLLVCSGKVYGLGTDSAWWRWENGMNWTRVVNDPCAVASPTPTATVQPSPVPSPTIAPTATPTPTPVSSPSITPICRPNTRPVGCVCRNNAPVRPNGKCP